MTAIDKAVLELGHIVQHQGPFRSSLYRYWPIGKEKNQKVSKKTREISKLTIVFLLEQPMPLAQFPLMRENDNNW